MEQITITERISTAVSRYPGRWIVAVSGGMDSMVLLDLLRVVKHDIVVAHLDHGLRVDSPADAELIASYCEKHDIPFTEKRVAIKRKKSQSIETVAREARYAFLQSVREQHGASYIVTAHTKNDQAETVLLHLVRGSGLQGLQGMHECTGTILRPLLMTLRDEIEQYQKEHDVPYRTDSTNSDIQFSRNFIRHTVLPKLHQLNPAVLDSIETTAAIATDAQQFIVQGALAWMEQHTTDTTVPTVQLLTLHPALQYEIVRQLYKRDFGTMQDVTYAEITELITWIHEGTNGSRKRWGSRWVYKEYDAIFFGESIESEQIRTALSIPGETTWGTICFRAEQAPYQSRSLPRAKSRGSGMGQAADRSQIRYNADIAVLDHAKISSELFVRTWRPGDIFCPSGSQGRKKISDYFTDQKVPRRLRASVPLVVTADNEIVWVGGYRVSEQFRATPQTNPTQVLIISLTHGRTNA